MNSKGPLDQILCEDYYRIQLWLFLRTVWGQRGWSVALEVDMRHERRKTKGFLLTSVQLSGLSCERQECLED